MKRCIALLLATLVISCGGGGDGGSAGGGSSGAVGTPVGGGGDDRAIAAPGARIEESNSAVILSGAWTSADPRLEWSGGAAVQSDVVGATVSFTFKGTSVRWLGSRGRGMGTARVTVDGQSARQVDLFMAPNNVRAAVLTINDLSDATHTLTIEVVSGLVVVDAFDV